MAENNYPIPDAPVYDPNIRALQDSDPASASSVFNPLLTQLISNIHAVKLLADGKANGDSMQEALQDIANSFDAINTALNGKAASNHSHTAAQVGAAAASHSHNAATTSTAGFMAAADKSKLDGIAAKATANVAGTTAPKALGTASAGSEAAYSRVDHVHPKPSLADLGGAAKLIDTATSATNTDFNTLALGKITNLYFNSGDPNGTYHAPIKDSSAAWYIVCTFGIATRIAQIAYEPYAHHRKTFIRYKHDSTWSDWTEIGKANHTHTAAQIGALKFIPLNYTDTLNVDNLTTDGIYSYAKLVGTLPDGFIDTQGQLLVLDYNTYWPIQLIRSPHTSGGKIFMRTRNGTSTWTAWKNIADGGAAKTAETASAVESSGVAIADSAARPVWLSSSGTPNKRVTSSLTFREDTDMLTTNISGSAATARDTATKLGRSDNVNAANTAYTTYMARGIAASSATPSSLTNGCIHLKYA